MVEYKTMRYVYNNLEEALRMATSFMNLFLEEGVYDSHKIVLLSNGRYMVNVKVTV